MNGIFGVEKTAWIVLVMDERCVAGRQDGETIRRPRDDWWTDENPYVGRALCPSENNCGAIYNMTDKQSSQNCRLECRDAHAAFQT